MALKVALFLSLLVMCLAPGPGFVVQSSTQPQAPSATRGEDQHGQPARVFTDDDNGVKVTVAKGSTLLVRLAANLTTGYSWRVGGDPAPLSLDSTKFQPGNTDKAVAGSPGVQLMQFKAAKPGTAALVLEYRRPWEKNVAPAKTYQLQVTVK